MTRCPGMGGADTIDGGTGDDIIDGGEGFDDLNGGTGDDIITGGEGDDTIIGAEGGGTPSWAATATTQILSDFAGLGLPLRRQRGRRCRG